MKRTIALTIFVLLFGSLFQTLAVFLPSSLRVFLLPPVVLIFSLRYFRSLETLAVSILCGGIIDILAGAPLGMNMGLILLFSVALGSSNLFLAKIGPSDFFYRVALLSFVYRIALLFSSLVLFKTRVNFVWHDYLLGPPIDGLVGVVFYHGLSRVLISFRIIDRHEFFISRLGTR